MGSKAKVSVRKVMLALLVLLLAVVAFFAYRDIYGRDDIVIADNLDSNIFPALVLSTATTDTTLVVPVDSSWTGNPKAPFNVTLVSPKLPSTVRLVVGETKFTYESVSEYKLANPNTAYTIYPEINWKYDELKANTQPTPISFSITVEGLGKERSEKIYTMSMRTVNECMTSYIDKKGRRHDTSILFAAYVNEDTPLIDQILREALDTRIVNRFWGYQSRKKNVVQDQVYAIWHVLQMRNFKYSSISNSSLSSSKVVAQKVRTFEDAFQNSQINCVDGSVMMASLLRAINIDPVLVKTPTHMFIGYYLDRKHTEIEFLETSMIGDVNLDDYFPDELPDSTMEGKSQREVSRMTFERARQYAADVYAKNKERLEGGEKGYSIIDISSIREKIQPIGL